MVNYSVAYIRNQTTDEIRKIRRRGVNMLLDSEKYPKSYDIPLIVTYLNTADNELMRRGV